MGRLQPTVVIPPQANRRSDRSKKAKDTINRVIPDLLKSNPRARHGVHDAKLINDPPALKNNHAGTATPGMDESITIRLVLTDTLTAARQMTTSSRRASQATGFLSGTHTSGKVRNVCILNMASPLRPGGGFLEGATSQEEFLCMRTTLYPSLWDIFYRLPEVGGIWTPDMIVHRDSTPEANDLSKGDRYFVDVISSGMLRFPETNTAKRAEGEEGGEAGCSCGVSYCDRDRELVTRKMRAVLRIAQEQGAEKLVLGAWGCGAYGNPVKEVAKIWKRVLFGTIRKKEDWGCISEVTFAINDRGMMREFERCFADLVTQEPILSSPPPELIEGVKTPTSDLISELVSKIQETELQLDQISNPRSKARLREIIANLNRQLAQVGSEEEDEMPPGDPTGEHEEADEDTTMGGGMAASDGEENSYYNFDSDDVASSGSVSPDASDLYEFRVSDPAEPTSPYSRKMSDAFAPNDRRRVSTSRFSSYEYVNNVGVIPGQQFDQESGWFGGSIDGLSALLSKPAKAPGSPVLRPQSSDMDADGIGMGLGEYLRRYSDQEL